MRNCITDRLKKIYDYIESNLFYIAVLFICFISYGFCHLNSFSSDEYFLWSRFRSIIDCIKDGNYPYYYYSDFAGVGYGVSFFYGQLTLFPFLLLPFLYERNNFLQAYMLVTLVLTYAGCCSFAKNYTKNYKDISILFMVSCLYITFRIPANKFAFGLSLLFLSYCVKFFRGKGNYIQTSLLFFLVLNTHLISALFSFLGCFVLFIIYFDRERIEEYVRFFITSLFLCLYNIANMLYHSTGLDFGGHENLSDRDLFSSSSLVLSQLPFTSYLLRLKLSGLFNVSGSGVMILAVALFSLYYLYKRRNNLGVAEKIVVALFFVSVFISEKSVWSLIYDVSHPIFQFPTRFLLYVLLFYLIVCFRKADIKYIRILSVVCLVDAVLGFGFMTYDSSRPDKPESQWDSFDTAMYEVENGEYLEGSFVWNLDYFKDKASNVYVNNEMNLEYTENNGRLEITVPEHDENWVLTVPKLYYRGYVSSYGKLYDGNDQFIRVDIGDEDGLLYVYYKHPLFLIVLHILTILLVIYLIMRLAKDLFR